jgi:hypothetical protein
VPAGERGDGRLAECCSKIVYPLTCRVPGMAVLVFRDDLDRHAAADQPGRPSIPGSVACVIAASRG